MWVTWMLDDVALNLGVLERVVIVLLLALSDRDVFQGHRLRVRRVRQLLREALPRGLCQPPVEGELAPPLPRPRRAPCETELLIADSPQYRSHFSSESATNTEIIELNTMAYANGAKVMWKVPFYMKRARTGESSCLWASCW